MAQNLVPNGSFEEYSDCPEIWNMGSGQFEKCDHWWYPSLSSVGTPDYYNVCNNTIGGPNEGLVGVPNNFWGYQEAFHGDAYIGLGLFDYNVGNDVIQGTEYASTKLVQNLESCTMYRFSCYISLANLSSHASNNFGVLFSPDSVFIGNFSYGYDLQPQFSVVQVVSDTSTWVYLEFDFLANGGEKFMTIGGFNDFYQFETEFNDSSIISMYNAHVAYYYVDSVSLLELYKVDMCIPEIPNVFTPNNDFTNDQYTIEGLDITEMVIFNRWGNVIVTLTEGQPIWDGTSKGEPCSEGSYFYRTKFGNQILSGSIELIR